MLLGDYLVFLVAIDRRSNVICRNCVDVALLDGIVDQEGLQEIACDVAYAIFRNVVDEKLYFFEMNESALLIFRDCAEKIKNLGRRICSYPTSFSSVRVTESYLVAFAERNKDLAGSSVFALLFQISKMVERVDDRCVKRIVLLRG